MKFSIVTFVFAIATAASALSVPSKFNEETVAKVASSNLNKRNWFYKTEKFSGAKLALAKKKIASAAAKKAASTKKASSTKKAAATTTKKTTTSNNSSAKQSKPGDDWSSTPSNAPSNAVRHITPLCNKYVTVDSSYSACEDFSSKNGITQTQLFSWNAGLHGFGAHECDNLDDGKAYCVSISQ